MQLKIRYPDLERAARIVESMGGEYVDTADQVDTYFNSIAGRLKLRESFSHQSRQPHMQLIWYVRPESAGVRLCESLLTDLPDAIAMKESLSRAMGVRAEVRKTRDQYLWENVRIHFDRVEQAGRFIELEARIDADNDEALVSSRLATLCHQLQIPAASYVWQSYCDLTQAA